MRYFDAYIAGFELESPLDSVMNPAYHERVGIALRPLNSGSRGGRGFASSGLTRRPTVHALGIAASLACGVKENIGSMVKSIHAGMAARNGVTAARLAQAASLASEQRSMVPGYLVAMEVRACIGSSRGNWPTWDLRWEIRLG